MVSPPNLSGHPNSGVGTVRYSSWEKMRKNKPQSNSIAGGILLHSACGIHLTWAFWRPFVDSIQYFVLVIVFHLAAILSAWVCGGVLVNRFSKRVIYMGCSVPLIIGNVLFIVCYEEYVALLIARILIGLSHGAVYIVVMCHASENAVNSMRGRIVSAIGLTLATNALAMGANLLSVTNEYALNSQMRVGIISMALTGLALLVGAFLHYESVVFLLQKDRHHEALELMTKLRSESIVSWSIQNDFDELKRYVEQESKASRNIFAQGNTRPLLLVGLVRVLAFVTNNLYLNLVMVVWVTALIGSEGLYVAPILLTALRFIYALIPTFVADRFSRKSFITFPSYIGAAVLLLTAILLRTLNIGTMTWLVAGFAVTQACFGYGLEMAPHVVAAEAFALSKKALSIAFLFNVDHFLHVAATAFYFILMREVDAYLAVLFVAAILTGILGAVAQWLLPETRMMSLSQCRNEYLGGVHRGATYSRENVHSTEQGITYVH